MIPSIKKLINTITLISILFLTLSSCQDSQQQSKQANLQPTSLPKSAVPPPQATESLYTQDIEQFKTKKYNQRLEGLVGCWLMAKQYLDVYKSNYLFFKDLKLKEMVTLKLVKECMKKINRKQAILKITELVGKNIQPAKKYQQIIDVKIINHIFEEVTQLTIAGYNHYQPINNENVPIKTEQRESVNSSYDQIIVSSDLNDSQSAEQNPLAHQNQAQAQDSLHPASQESKPQVKNEKELNSFTTMSEFDLFLVDLLKNYNDEFQKLVTSKQGLKGRVQEELKKRQKYYFGFIPASSFTHSVFLVTISLSMLFCCTCFKYYRLRSKEKEDKKMKNSEQCEDNCKSHSHGHAKQFKKVALAKMTQMTMKKKTR